LNDTYLEEEDLWNKSPGPSILKLSEASSLFDFTLFDVWTSKNQVSQHIFIEFKNKDNEIASLKIRFNPLNINGIDFKIDIPRGRKFETLKLGSIDWTVNFKSHNITNKGVFYTDSNGISFT
jgi:hypothetical protein